MKSGVGMFGRGLVRKAGFGIAVLLASFSLIATAHADSDVYTVTNVSIDAMGVSPTDARDRALAQGRQTAFAIVFRRLTTQANWAKLPVLSPQELDNMVTGFQLDSEKLSTTRYLASASFTFGQAAVRDVMRRYGIAFSETKAKPVLVLAYDAGAAWRPDGGWAKAWGASAALGSLKPVVVPAGDATDVAEIGAITPAAADWPQVTSLAGRYGAGEVWIVVVSAQSGAASVQTVILRPSGRLDSQQTILAKPGEAVPNLLARTVASVRAAADEVWKADTSVDYANQATLEMTVPFSGLPEWVAIKRELNAIRLIQNIDVAEMQTRGARVRLNYLGKLEQLQAALRQANLTLADASGQGQWLLTRGTAPAISTTPDPATGAEVLIPPATVPAQLPSPAPSGAN